MAFLIPILVVVVYTEPEPNTNEICYVLVGEQRTMQAWVDSFGKPLLCAIQSGERLAGYLFEEGSRGVPVSRISRVRGKVLVAMA